MVIVIVLWEFDHATLAVWVGAVGCTMLGAVHAHTIARARTAFDETERLRHVVGDLQTAIGRLEGALDVTGEGVLVLDGHGRVAAINAAAAAFLGRAAESCRGQRLADVAPWPRLVEAVQACGSSVQPQLFEVQDDRAGVRTLAVRVQGLGALGAVIDLDDQSRLRQLESHRRDFVANVSHELKTPLAAIQGFVETMLDDEAMPVETRQRFLGKIARQSERLSMLVSDLLTLSRLDEGEVVQAVEPVDLGHVVRETLRDLQPMAERRRLRLRGDVVAQPLPIRSEPEALRQVVGNLIDNAIKYTPEQGSVTVRLELRDDQAHLEVVDTGIGLSAEDKERVFERFYRVDKARSRELGGTGLGLAIVKNVVRSLDGRIGVESELGRGSTFWVALPLARGLDHAG